MTQMSLMSERPSEHLRDMIAEKLRELEGRVKAAVALVAKVKAEKAVLQQRVDELQAVIKDQAGQLKARDAARQKDQEQLARMLEEREEVGLKVDRLIEEIARIEASLEPEP